MTLRWSIVVPLRNKAPVLREALGSIALATTERADAELIIVDHESSDGSADLARELAPHAIMLPLGRGTPALARNRGAAVAKGEFLWFVDADVRITPGHLDRLAAVFERTSADAAGCTVTVPPSDGWIARTWDRLHLPRGDGWRDWLAAANFAVRRTRFDAVAGFDAALETGEDAELCARLRAGGARIYEALDLKAEHLDNPRSLAAFFRKERWRGLGMLGTWRWDRLDRPVVMTVLHGVLLALGLGAGFWQPGAGVLLAAGLAFAVPAVTVMYRRVSTGSAAPLLPALLLYQLYYLARLAALARITREALTGRTPPAP